MTVSPWARLDRASPLAGGRTGSAPAAGEGATPRGDGDGVSPRGREALAALRPMAGTAAGRTPPLRAARSVRRRPSARPVLYIVLIFILVFVTQLHTTSTTMWL